MTNIVETQTEDNSDTLTTSRTGRHYTTATTQPQAKATTVQGTRRKGQFKTKGLVVKAAPELPAPGRRSWIDENGEIQVWSEDPTIEEFRSFLSRKDELHPLSEFWTPENVSAAARLGDEFAAWTLANAPRVEKDSDNDPLDILHDAKKFYARSGDSWVWDGVYGIPGGTPGKNTVRRDAYVPRHAPGAAPTSEEFVGQPVQVEIAHLVELVRKDPAEITELPRAERPAWHERKDRLACLVADVAEHYCRTRPSEFYYQDVISEIQRKFFEWVESDDVRPADKILSMLTGIISDAANRLENAFKRRIDIPDTRAVAEVNKASATMAEAGDLMKGAGDLEVAQLASDSSRRFKRSDAPERAHILSVLRGGAEDAEVSKAAEKVTPGLARLNRFAEALRVAGDDFELTLESQRQMIAEAVIQELGRKNSKPTISVSRALDIQRGQTVASIDHTEAGHDSESETDSGEVTADFGKPIENKTLSLAQYDKIAQAIDSLGSPRQEARSLTLRVTTDLGITEVEWIDNREGQIQEYNTFEQDVAWMLYGQGESTQQEIAERWGVSQSKVSRTMTKVEAAVGKFIQNNPVVSEAPREEESVASIMQSTERDELRDAYRWWFRQDAKAQRASLYTVPADEAFSGDLRALFEGTRLGRVTLREFCGWLQAQGLEGWHFSSAPQMFDQTRREYLDDSRGPAVTRSEDTEMEKAWDLFKGWFRRLSA